MNVVVGSEIDDTGYVVKWCDIGRHRGELRRICAEGWAEIKVGIVPDTAIVRYLMDMSVGGDVNDARDVIPGGMIHSNVRSTGARRDARRGADVQIIPVAVRPVLLLKPMNGTIECGAV